MKIRLRPHHLDLLRVWVRMGNPMGNPRPLKFPDGIVSPSRERFLQTQSNLFAVNCRQGAVVEIVEGIDDLCENCPQRRAKCEELRPEGDLWFLKNLKLRVGQRYSVEELLKKLGVSKKLRKIYLNPAN